MIILGISGSLKSTSSNTSILNTIAQIAPENCKLVLYKGLEDLPHFNPEIDNDPPPQAVSNFRKQIKSADAVIICTPEYAFGIPGSLKNALDWTVSSGELVEKPMAVISASPSFMGGDKALASLLLTLSALSADIPENATLSIPSIYKKLNEQNELNDTDTINQLSTLLNSLIKKGIQPE